MDFLSHTATSIALGVFVKEGKFSAFLRAKDMNAVADNLDLALSARDPSKAVWSLASQLESDLSNIKSREHRTLADNFLTASTLQDLPSLGDNEIHRENTAVVLAICYKYLGEERHVERALKSFDPDPQRDYNGAEKAILAGGVVIGATIGWVFGLAGNAAKMAISGAHKSPQRLADREEFQKRIRALQPWDGYEKYLTRQAGQGGSPSPLAN